MIEFKKITLHKDMPCMAALKMLDQEVSTQTIFVVDDSDRLIGTITDGDIRRGFLNGLTVDDPLHLFCYKHFSFLTDEINVPLIKELKREGIKVLPKLNEKGQIIRVYNLSKMNSILPLHAVVMAGGRGERLRPLTDKVPKPLLPLGQKPIIEHVIDRLIWNGIESVTITVQYLAEQLIEYFGDGSAKGIKINYIHETFPMGTIGCITQLCETPFNNLLVMNSDIFTNIDFENLFLTFEKENADMAVASIPYSVDIPYAIMELDDKKVISFKEKPRNTYYANAGIYLFRKEVIDLIPENRHFNATDLMDAVIKHNGKLIHNPITGYWIDIGRHDDYKKAQELIKHL